LNFNSKILILISDLFLTFFIQNAKTSDFCQSFVDNGYKVDYSFGGEPAFPGKGFLVINQNSWKFDVNHIDLTIGLVSDQSIRNNGFRTGYKIAFGTEIEETLGLINVNMGQRNKF